MPAGSERRLQKEAEMEMRRYEKATERDKTHTRGAEEMERGGRQEGTRGFLRLIRYLSSPSRGEFAKIQLVAAPGSSIIPYRRYEVSTDEVPGRPKKVQGKNRLRTVDPLPVLLGPPV